MNHSETTLASGAAMIISTELPPKIWEAKDYASCRQEFIAAQLAAIERFCEAVEKGTRKGAYTYVVMQELREELKAKVGDDQGV